MDAVPDMDALLDQLEASEEAAQNQPCAKTNKENVVKPERKFFIPITSHVSTIITEKLNDRETANIDSTQQLSHLKDLLNVSDSSLVDEANFEGAHLTRENLKKDEKSSDEEVNQQAVSSSSCSTMQGSVNTLSGGEHLEDFYDAVYSVKKSSEIGSSNVVVDRTRRAEPIVAGDRHSARRLCDLPEADQSPTAVKERLADKLMRITVQRFNNEETHFARSCADTAKELDQMAEEFEEMDRYLARCATESAQLKVSDSIAKQDTESLNIQSTAAGCSSNEAESAVKDNEQNKNPQHSEGSEENVDSSVLADHSSKTRVADGGGSKTKVSGAERESDTAENEETLEKKSMPAASLLSEGSEMAQPVRAVRDERVDVVVEDALVGGQNEESFVSRDLASQKEMAEWEKESVDIVESDEEQPVTSDIVTNGNNIPLPDGEQSIQAGTDEGIMNAQEIDGNPTSTGGTSADSMAANEIHEEAKGSAEVKKETKRDERGKEEEEGEEASEEAGIEDDAEEPRGEDATAVSPVEEAQGVSVVASTHDISSETDLRRLTESELQLGKVKPVWIADSETTSCMLCCTKFTLILRRHHCRSCGRVLCAQCTAHKAVLPYMNDALKKFKVCEPCFQTLKRIDDYEKSLGQQESSTHADVNEARASSTALIDVPRVKSVLKIKSSEGSEEAGESTERSFTPGEISRRSVTFRDGVNPGDGAADRDANSLGNVPEPSSLIPKPKKKRASVTRRVKELRMEEENVCLLPKSTDDSLYRRNADGSIEKLNLEEANRSIANGQIVVVAVSRNLWCNVKTCKLDCCGLGRVMCVCSCGMLAVGLDEILIVYDLDEDEQCCIPIDIIRRIREIYECSLKPQNESFDERMGIRAAHLRVPTLHSTLHKNELNEFAARDILLFRPSLQCFDNLIVPSSPFLVACFIHQCETLWALAIPNRLLYRIGLQASYYPTPIVNRREREPVYTSLSDTTVLKVFTDFRNWSYRLLRVHGSTLDLQDDESRLVIPTWAKDDLKNLVESNRNMIAFALDFNAHADSHLVCEQDAAGSYRTQVFTTGVTARKVTGASFLIVDGALKSGDVPLSVSVVEDGIAIRLRADAMIAFAEALIAGEDYRLESNTMKFSLEWRNVPPRGSIGELISPIDQSSLVGNYEYGLTESRILSSLYTIPSVNEWALRLVAVYNVAKGKFAPLIQSKVFAVSEQISAQVAYTLVPFVASLISNNIREICIRIRVTSDDAGYNAAEWPNMEQEYLAWKDLLDNQLVPGLFNICSYIPSGFDTELSMALVSTRALP